MRALVEKQPTISRFYMSGQRFTEVALAELMRCPNLSLLSISNCESLTDVVFDHMKVWHFFSLLTSRNWISANQPDTKISCTYPFFYIRNLTCEHSKSSYLSGFDCAHVPLQHMRRLRSLHLSAKFSKREPRRFSTNGLRTMFDPVDGMRQLNYLKIDLKLKEETAGEYLALCNAIINWWVPALQLYTVGIIFRNSAVRNSRCSPCQPPPSTCRHSHRSFIDFRKLVCSLAQSKRLFRLCRLLAMKKIVTTSSMSIPPIMTINSRLRMLECKSVWSLNRL